MANYWGSVSNNTSKYGCYLEVTESNVSTENNTSLVTVKFHITRSNYGWQTSNSYSGSITIDGSSYSFSYSPNWAYASSGDVVVATASKTVTHNDEGSKTCPVSATWNTSGTYSCGTASASGSMILTKIPRASGIACSSPYIGDVGTITIDRKAATFTNTVTYDIGGITGTVATKTSSTTLSLVTEDIVEDIYALIPDTTQIQGTVYCTTYSGDTQIGSTTSAKFNLYAKEADAKPDISATIVDTNESTIAITGNSSKLIKHASKPKVTITATPKYSAEIKSYSINLNDGQTSTLQEATFESIGSDSITVNAIDSRGYGNPQTIALEMIDYTKLHIDIIDISRTEDVSSEAILNASGVWFNGSFSENNTNSLTASFQYKLSGEASWTDGGTLTPTTDGNNFTFENVSLGNIYSYENEYQFKIILSDLLTTVGSENKEAIILPKGQEVVAIGDDTVWVYGDLLLNDENILDKMPKILNTHSDSQTDVYSCDYVNQIIESGSNANGSYIKYANGTAICMKKGTLTRDIVNAMSSGTATLYRTATLSIGDLPITLTEVNYDEVNATSEYVSEVALAWSNKASEANTSTFPTFLMYSLGYTTGRTIKYSTIVIGKWK